MCFFFFYFFYFFFIAKRELVEYSHFCRARPFLNKKKSFLEIFRSIYRKVLVDSMAVLLEYDLVNTGGILPTVKKSLLTSTKGHYLCPLLLHILSRDALAGHFGLTDSNSPGLKSRGFNAVRVKPGSTLLADYTFVVSRAILVHTYA